MFKLKNKKRFSLVDFLIVVVILGILAVVVIPKLFGIVDYDYVRSCRGNMAVINATIEGWMYMNPNTKFAALTIVTNDTDRFPDGPPKCPAGGTYTLGTDNRVQCSIHGQVDSGH